MNPFVSPFFSKGRSFNDGIAFFSHHILHSVPGLFSIDRGRLVMWLSAFFIDRLACGPLHFFFLRDRKIWCVVSKLEIKKEYYSIKRVKSRRELLFDGMRQIIRVILKRILGLYCPAIFSHISPAPVKRDCVVRICTDVWLEVYNEGLRLIDWFNPPSEKLPHGDDFRVRPKGDRTPRDNTVL